MAEKIPAGKSQTEAEKRINFSVLKKHDEKIDKIIDTASSVAHYKFNSLSAVWVSFCKNLYHQSWRQKIKITVNIKVINQG